MDTAVRKELSEGDAALLHESLRRFVRTTPVTVGVCVITYKRPKGLHRCLQSLQLLQFRLSSTPHISIFVVDNDPSASAQPIVQQLQTLSKWPITYDVEPTRGISYARNRAVSLAKDCDFIAFIDDDEYADPFWLDELLETQRLHNADVVAGSVIPEFDEGVPDWIKRAWPNGRRRGKVRTGSQVGFAITGNCLFRANVLRDIPEPFEPRLALTGGSDRFLGLRLSRQGHKIVWCNESVVHEIVPPSRSNIGWMLRRAYRTGNDGVLCEKLLPREIRKSPVLRGVRAVIRIPIEASQLLAALLKRRRAEATKHLLNIAQAWGTITGLLGIRYEEYRRIHGS